MSFEMNVWCLLLLVCVCGAPEPPAELKPYIIEKAVAFYHVADRNGDGKLVFADYRLISEYVLTIPDYRKCNASYLFDVITVNSWTAFPNQEMTLEQFLYALATIDPAAMKAAVYALTKSMFEAWDYLAPAGCLNAVEIGWELRNLGKYNEVELQAEKAINAMTKTFSLFGSCATLEQYQATAYDYLTVEDLNHDSKYFFGYLGGK